MRHFQLSGLRRHCRIVVDEPSPRADRRSIIPDVVELSGPGAVSGTNWRDGVALAIDEINKAGGILGRKIETEHLDTQSNPGISRAQIQKVLDRDPYVVLGPIYSGSVKVNMALTQQAEVPQIVGAEAADITTQGNPWVFRTAFGQQIIDAEDRQLSARQAQGEIGRGGLGQQ